MAIAIDATSHGNILSGSTLTIAHTVGNGIANGILAIGISVSGSVTVSSVTYNSVTMTQLTTRAQGSQNGYIYYLLSPTNDGVSHNIVVTLSSSLGTCIGCAISYSGVAQSSTWGTAAVNSAASGNSSDTVATTATTQKVFDVNWTNAASTATPGAGQTKEVTDTSSIGTMDVGDINGTGGNISLSWTNPTNTGWIEMAAAMSAAGAAAPSKGGTMMLMGVGFIQEGISWKRGLKKVLLLSQSQKARVLRAVTALQKVQQLKRLRQRVRR